MLCEKPLDSALPSYGLLIRSDVPAVMGRIPSLYTVVMVLVCVIPLICCSAVVLQSRRAANSQAEVGLGLVLEVEGSKSSRMAYPSSSMLVSNPLKCCGAVF